MPEARIVWLDLEDDADAIGDIDVESLPALMIARDDAVLFAGTVLPQTAQIDALMRVGREGGLKPLDAAAEAASGFHALLERLRAGLTGVSN